jgi:hypothetical protein
VLISFEIYKRPWPKAKLQDTNMLKVLIYLTWCKRRNIHYQMVRSKQPTGVLIPVV